MDNEKEITSTETKTVSKEETKKKNGIGKQIYEQLMNGINHMLPFVVGGGILMAIAYLIDGLSVDMEALTESERANFGSITQTAALFKEIGKMAFDFMLPILAGFIASAIGGTSALVIGVVGGFIAANGKSGFIGALVAGYVAGYLFLLLKKCCSKMPKALEGLAPVVIYPTVGVFVMGLAMRFAIEPIMGVVNSGLNSVLTSMGGSSMALLGFVLGGMMSVDMGGPCNKAAYFFNVAAMSAGNYTLMPCVMAGGMIPPCACALSALIFRNKFTKEEKKTAPTSFIMGLAFVSEGAIPYVAKDPVRVLVSCILGAGVGGALTAIFGITLMAPHGGIFVFPVASNPLLYLLAFAIGTVTAAVLMGIMKKKVTE